jgi:hypothetical protein
MVFSSVLPAMIDVTTHVAHHRFEDQTARRSVSTDPEELQSHL